jgi:hypothetical protein
MLPTVQEKQFINTKLVLYCLVLFFASIGTAELIVRSSVVQSTSLNRNPLQKSNYSPAIDHLSRIELYVEENGAPDCIFFGSSLVRTGINTDLFEEAFRNASGEVIHCYNAGMDGSSLSSTLPIALLFAQKYQPTYIILGVQRNSFSVLQPTPFSSSNAEDRLDQNSWIQYQLGAFNIEGWVIDNSALYRTLTDIMLRWFPMDTPVVASQTSSVSTRIRPEVPRITNIQGYSPLPGYRDTSPMVQPDFTPANSALVVDPKDLAALDTFMLRANNDEFKLILVEMPVHSTTDVLNQFMRQIEALARQNGIPFLSTDRLTPLPATAYADQIHLHISGSFMFSEWLGRTLGTAVGSNALTDANASLWSPTREEWTPSTYTATLGMSSASFALYQETAEKFDLVPEEAIILNPSNTPVDKVFTQSLLGFAFDWEGERRDDYLAYYLQLMVVLERMRYPQDLALSASEEAAIRHWHATTEPSLLYDMGIHYVVCRRELADTTVRHCPDLRNNPNYIQIGQWNFDPLYEQYTLYQVASPR